MSYTATKVRKAGLGVKTETLPLLSLGWRSAPTSEQEMEDRKAVILRERELQAASPDTNAGRKAARQNRMRQATIEVLKTGAPQTAMLALLGVATCLRKVGYLVEAKSALLSCLELGLRFRDRLQRGKEGTHATVDVIRWMRCEGYISKHDSRWLLQLVISEKASEGYIAELYTAAHKVCDGLAHWAVGPVKLPPLDIRPPARGGIHIS